MCTPQEDGDDNATYKVVFRTQTVGFSGEAAAIEAARMIAKRENTRVVIYCNDKVFLNIIPPNDYEEPTREKPNGVNRNHPFTEHILRTS